MDSSSSYDAIVVGAGIMGSCTAYHLSKLNQRTLLVEQFDLLHPLGSSHGLSRTIRLTYPETYYPPLVSLSKSLFHSAESESGYKVLTPTVHLDIGPVSDLSLKSAIENSMEHEMLGRGDLLGKFSGAFKLPEGEGEWTAVETPLGGVINPTKAVAMFQSLAARLGTVIKDHAEVVDIKKDESGGNIQVQTSGGEVFCGKKVIITAGGWIHKLVKTVSGADLPVQPVHTIICYWKVKDGHEGELTPQAGFPTFASYGEPYIYGTPSLEYPGLIKIAMHGGSPCDPDHRDWRSGSKSGLEVSSNTLVDPVTRWIEQVMPGHVDPIDGPVMTQACMYSMTPDGDFIIDFLGGEFGKDVVVAGGFSGHGFKMGPAIGKILAEMALEGEASVPEGVDMGKFTIGRFRDNPNGNVKIHEAQVSFHNT